MLMTLPALLQQIADTRFKRGQTTVATSGSLAASKAEVSPTH
jgi:hypothetical protein